jgi:hypothetical protein
MAWRDLQRGILEEFAELQRAIFQRFDCAIPEWAARQIAAKVRSDRKIYRTRRAAGLCVRCEVPSALAWCHACYGKRPPLSPERRTRKNAQLRARYRQQQDVRTA